MTRPQPWNAREKTPWNAAERVLLLAHNLFYRVGLRLTWRGLVNVPAEGAVLLAANHRSWFDPYAMHCPLLTVRGRFVRFMAWDRLFDNPILNYYLRRSECFPTSQDGQEFGGFRTAIKMLRDDKTVGVFPEGGIECDAHGMPGTFHPGIAKLAIMGRAPIVPVTIQGTEGIWPQGRRLPRAMPRVRVTYHEPVILDRATVRRRRRDPDFEKEVIDQVRRRVVSGIDRPLLTRP